MVLGLPASAVAPLPQIIRNAVAKVILKNKARSCHLSKEFPHLSEWKPKTLIWPSGPLLTVTPSHHVPALSGSLCQATLTCLIALKPSIEEPQDLCTYSSFCLTNCLSRYVPGALRHFLWVPSQMTFINEIIFDTNWYGYMCICVCLHIYVFIYDLSYVWFVGCLSPPARM